MINKIRKYLKKRKLGIVDKYIDISLDATFAHYKNIIWHNNIYIGPKAYIWAIGGLEIMDNVIIGPRITIHTSNHNYDNATLIPYDGKTILKKVTIEKNVWIGDNVMIVPGTTIGEGSIVAMGSVVTKDVPKYSIVGGNPAKIIKTRNIELYKKLNEEKKFYLKYKKENKVKWEKING